MEKELITLYPSPEAITLVLPKQKIYLKKRRSLSMMCTLNQLSRIKGYEISRSRSRY